MTQYRKGRRAEYAARDILHDDGYPVVLRTAGSHGIVDLVAIQPGHVRLVQVKSTAKLRPSYAAELDELRAWQVPDCCVKELWVWLRRKREWLVMTA